MINRFSSLKTLRYLRPTTTTTQTTTTILPRNPSISAHPIPKTYIASTFDELSPKRKNMPSFNKESKNTSFSGSQFIKKSQEKAKELLHEFAHLVVHGSKSAYKDAKTLYNISSNKSKDNYTVEEIREVKRITIDLIKFVPFYASIIIPAGELALIPYLFLFPRAIPSYFMAEKVIRENKDKSMEKQFEAHQHLKQYLIDAMVQLGYDASVRDPEAMRKFFVENKEKLSTMLSTNQMSSNMLKNASDFLMFDYIEGTYILNLLYKTTVNLPRYGINLAMWMTRNSYRANWNHSIFNYNFKMNSFPFEGAKRLLIKHQFQKQLKAMKAQDNAMRANLFGNLAEEQMLDVAKERGFYTDKQEHAKNWLEQEWNQNTQNHTDDTMSLFWLSVIRYESL